MPMRMRVLVPALLVLVLAGGCKSGGRRSAVLGEFPTGDGKEGAPMQLWTYHPGDFRIDAADLVIDPVRGYYWHYSAPGFRYREMLPVLQRRFGTDQFLWCYSIRGEFIRASEDHDVVEWALNVPDSQILGRIRASV
jgi:hypothetical protein